MENELLTLPHYMLSPSGFSGEHAAHSLAFCIVYYRSVFVLVGIMLLTL